MKTHKDLDVWKQSIALAEAIYILTAKYPKEETFGLVSQLRRAVVSVSSNIAEGAARSSDKEFIRFLYTALGSVSELDTQLEISMQVNMGDRDEIIAMQGKVEQIARMLQGLIRSVKQRVT